MSEPSKYIKQIQARLSRKGIKVSYGDIKPVFREHCSDLEPNEEQLSTIVEQLTQHHQPSNPMLTESPGAEEMPITTSTPHPIFDRPPTTEASLATTEQRPLPQNLPQDWESETNIVLSHPNGLSPQTNAVKTIAPPEAIAIIQEIAADDSSQNKAVAQRLLAQANEKTDTIVNLVAALPQIEAEMLKRKLQKMPRQQVNYEGVLDSYFQESRGFTQFVNTLTAEYGISLEPEGKHQGELSLTRS